MIKSYIKKITVYKPPLEGRTEKKYLLLDFNERTTEPSRKVKDALKKFINSGKLQLYPEYGDLETKIARYAKVKKDQVITVNGSDQGIDIIARAYLSEGDKAITPFPAFPMHCQAVALQGAKILEPVYKEGKAPVSKILDLIAREKRLKLVILCNPNNPTGIAISLEDTERIVEKAKAKEIAVLHDEAYFEFSGITAKNLISKYDNLYIVRTFSKPFGLAGLRIGYIISQEKNILELLKIRGPYAVNIFAKTAVIAALEDKKYMEDYVKEVMEKSKPRIEEFLRKEGIKFFPSRTNFLFLDLKNAEKIAMDLKKRGILTRPKELPEGGLGLRISIGTLENTEKFISVLAETLKKNKK